VVRYFSIPATTTYTCYNDYLIFKQSFFHLLHHTNLYSDYPKEYNDLYKYSPTFAVFIAPFAVLPNLVGLILWNCLNGVLLFYVVAKLPFETEARKLYAHLFMLISMLTSIIVAESNCLMAALIISAYLLLEGKQLIMATLIVAVSAYIKPYGIAAFALFAFYPGKWKAFLWSSLWMCLLFALPLLFTTANELAGIYKDWLSLLQTDHTNGFGDSIMGFLNSCFGINDKMWAVCIGMLFLLLPLSRFSLYNNNKFKALYLSSILIWVVIFNHKAETPAFIIAVTGIAIWYFMQEYRRLNTILLLLAFLFTVLEPTDIYNRYIRDHILTPYVVKVIPCTLIWLKITFDLLTGDFTRANKETLALS
jgi:hypothetical protein